MKTTTLNIILVYAMLCLIWGSTWLGIRIGLESLTPFVSAGFRFSLASFVILMLMKVRNVQLQKDRLSIILYLQMGFLSFIIPFGLVYWAEQFVPSGLASVLFAVYPFFVALFSFLWIPSEKIGAPKIIGMVMGFIGIVIIFSDSFSTDISDYLLGMFAVVLSGIMQAWIAVTLKKYGGHLNPLSMNLVPMIIAGVGMMIIGFAIEDTSQLKFDENAILSVLYLAIFGSVLTFTSFYWLLKRVNVVILSLIAFITPIVALLLGWIFYNEHLTSKHFIGTIFVLIGLLVANLGSYFLKNSAKKPIKSE